MQILIDFLKVLRLPIPSGFVHVYHNSMRQRMQSAECLVIISFKSVVC